MIEAQLDVSSSPERTPQHGDTRERVRAFIASNFYVADAAALKDTTSLLESGIIDSTGVLEVIAYLESEFGFQVRDDEMLPENLDSVGAIVGYIARKQG